MRIKRGAESYDTDEEHHAMLRRTLVDGWAELEPVAHFVNPGSR
jgi:hypothetical protein